MKPLFICMLLSIICFATHAQNFSKAKITTTRNQIIDCFIKNTKYEGTPQSFFYASSVDGNLTAISGTAIQKIEFADGTVYEKHFLRVPVIFYDYIDRNSGQYEVESNYVRGDRLVEKLISGPVALYQFVDSFQYSHFFYLTNSDSEIVLLPYKTYVENSLMHYDKEYKNFLIFLSESNQCPKNLFQEIEGTKYTMNDISRIFKKLNSCAGQTVEINNPMYHAHTEFNFGLLGGVSLTSLHFYPDQGYYPGLSENSFSNSFMPVIGIYIDILPAKKIKNYLVSFELYYHLYKSETDSIKINTFTSSIALIKFSTVNLNPAVRYFLNNHDKAKPFIEGAMNLSVIINKEDHYDSYSSGQKSSFPIFKNKGMDLMLGAGTGLDYKKFSIGLRYQFSTTRTTAFYDFLSATIKYNLTK